MLSIRFRFLAAFLLVCGLGLPVTAAEVPKDVRSALAPALARVQQAKSCQVKIRQSGGVRLNGKPVQELPEVMLQVSSESPNRMSVTTSDGNQTSTPVVSDGKHLFFMASADAYLRLESPKNFGTITEAMVISFGPLDSVLLPITLAGADPSAVIFDDVTKAEIVGSEKIGDRDVVHVRLSDEEATWEFWVSTDKTSELLKLQADLSKGLRQANPQFAASGNLEFIATAEFNEWNIDTKLNDGVFKFNAPDGAKGYDSIAEMQDAMQGPPPLLGEAAPEFKLATLDGKEFDLAAHIGKDVVMLDFWATWCGPCRKGLPVVAAVAKELADQGVVAYAVNLQESAEEIKDFLKEFPLEIGIALDIDASVASKFKVQGIPHSVLIGKDGLVQAVHVGFSEEDVFKTQLTEELTALLAGKSLLDEKNDAPADSETPKVEPATRK